MKRGFDLLVGIALLVLASPVMAVAAALIGATMGRPILFRQRRPGLRGRPFTILKFRTMSNRTCDEDSPESDAQRLTAVGGFLRRASVDELPQLVNVLRGDMSLVGPRPLLMEYLPLYTPEQARRHEVRPGMTGLAQVEGRNTLGWEDVLRLDVYYVDHRSLRLDLNILARTLARVVRGSGTAESRTDTRERFRGTRS